MFCDGQEKTECKSIARFTHNSQVFHRRICAEVGEKNCFRMRCWALEMKFPGLLRGKFSTGSLSTAPLNLVREQCRVARLGKCKVKNSVGIIREKNAIVLNQQRGGFERRA